MDPLTRRTRTQGHGNGCHVQLPACHLLWESHRRRLLQIQHGHLETYDCCFRKLLVALGRGMALFPNACYGWSVVHIYLYIWQFTSTDLDRYVAERLLLVHRIASCVDWDTTVVEWVCDLWNRWSRSRSLTGGCSRTDLGHSDDCVTDTWMAVQWMILDARVWYFLFSTMAFVALKSLVNTVEDVHARIADLCIHWKRGMKYQHGCCQCHVQGETG